MRVSRYAVISPITNVPDDGEERRGLSSRLSVNIREDTIGPSKPFLIRSSSRLVLHILMNLGKALFGTLQDASCRLR